MALKRAQGWVERGPDKHSGEGPTCRIIWSLVVPAPPREYDGTQDYSEYAVKR